MCVRGGGGELDGSDGSWGRWLGVREGVSVVWVGGKPGLETVQGGSRPAIFLACSLNCSQNIVF